MTNHTDMTRPGLMPRMPPGMRRLTWRLKPLPHAWQQLLAAITAGCPRAAGWQAQQIVRLQRERLEAGGLLRPRSARHLRRTGQAAK